MKALKIILVTAVVIGVLIYLITRYVFRTTSEDIAHLAPFSEIIGKELTIVQPSRIALNYEHWVKENEYILQIENKSFSAKATKLQKLPLGTILKIKEAKRYTNGVTGSKSTYLLGFVFLEDLQKEVAFEFAWGSKNYSTDLKGDYFSYPLAPWQKEPLAFMYNYAEDIIAPYENYHIKKENIAKDATSK